MNDILLWLEVGQLIASLLIVAVAFLGLKQITVTREASETESKRDSLKCAADQTSFFVKSILPIINQQDKDQESYDFFDCFEVEVLKNDYKIKLVNKDKKKLKSLGGEELETVVNLVNTLEQYSVYFTSGVADEEVGFKSNGLAFVKTVKKLLPLINLLEKKGYYSSLIQLFYLWNNRLENKDLITQKEFLEKQTNNLESKISEDDEVICPVGVNK